MTSMVQQMQDSSISVIVIYLKASSNTDIQLLAQHNVTIVQSLVCATLAYHIRTSWKNENSSDEAEQETSLQ